MSKSLKKLINKIQDEELKIEFQDWYYSNVFEIRKEYQIDDLKLEQANCRDTFIEHIQYSMDKELLSHLNHYIVKSISENKLDRNTLLTCKLTVIKGELE